MAEEEELHTHTHLGILPIGVYFFSGREGGSTFRQWSTRHTKSQITDSLSLLKKITSHGSSHTAHAQKASSYATYRVSKAGYIVLALTSLTDSGGEERYFGTICKLTVVSREALMPHVCLILFDSSSLKIITFH